MQYELVELLELDVSIEKKIGLTIMDGGFSSILPRGEKGTFTLVIRAGDDKENRKNILETWSNLSIDPEEPNYYAKVIGNQDRNIHSPDSSDPFIQLSGSYVNHSKYVRVEEVLSFTEFLKSDGSVRISGSATFHGLPAVGSGSVAGAFSTGHSGNGAAGWGNANIASANLHSGNGGNAGEA